jgi:hypothetical protein
MALTFAEATAQLGPAAPGVMNVLSTLVITQNNSITAWGRGGLILTPAGSLGNLGNDLHAFPMQFSDRGASNPFSGDTDRIELNLAKVSSSTFEATIVLKRWGDATYKVNLTRKGKSKMMTGWGNAIGVTSRQVVYDAERVILA